CEQSQLVCRPQARLGASDSAQVVLLIARCYHRQPDHLRTRSVSYAHMAISTRFRAPSFPIRLVRWVFTVLRLMWSVSAISELVRPRATVSKTSSSRPV